MVDHSEPAAHTPQGGVNSSAPQLPPPPPRPGPQTLPPPPAGPPFAGQPRKRSEMKAAITALVLSLVGWLVWLYAWVAEADTGYPDGLACTANPETSEAYASCMRSAERGGAIAWSLTLGMAVAGIVLVVRSRRGRLFDAGARWWAIAAGVFSGLLAIAGVNVWLRGATGAFYEDRLGATSWHLTMIIAVGVGLIVGWAVTRRRQEAP